MLKSISKFKHLLGSLHRSLHLLSSFLPTMLLSPEFPAWLRVLLTEKFFNACIIHEEAKKNEKNILCLDCCVSICPHCLIPHASHRLLQIRRYVYHDVLRLEDAARLLDSSFIQAYTTNSSKVVFINQRPQTRQFKGSASICYSCHRTLQHPYLYCCLSCKINYLIRMERGLSRFLFDCKFMPFSDHTFDECLMTPKSTLEPAGSARSSSGSSAKGDILRSCALTSTATTNTVRRKRNSLDTCRGTSASPSVSENVPTTLFNRRKITPPQRAPLY